MQETRTTRTSNRRRTDGNRATGGRQRGGKRARRRHNRILPVVIIIALLVVIVAVIVVILAVNGNKTDIAECAVTVDISSVFYDGSAKEPAVTVIDMSKDSVEANSESGRILEAGKDYKVEYANNVEVGTASATVNGVGGYKGSVTVSFEIVPTTQTVSLAKSGSSEMYVGETLLITTEVTAGETLTYVSSDEHVAEVNEYGMVTAKNAGTVTITVTSQDKNAISTQNLTVRVSLAAPELNELTATDTGIEISWTCVTGAKLYEVYRMTDGDKEYEQIGEVYDDGSQGESYSDTDVNSRETYTYYVLACSDEGDIVSASGTKQTITYLVPPKLTAVQAVSSSSILVTWTGESDEDQYELQYATDESFTTDLGTLEADGSTSVSRTLKELTENTDYYIRVRTCVDDDGTVSYSAWSEVKMVTTLDASEDRTPGKVRTDDWLTVFAGDSITYGLTEDSLNAITNIQIEGEKDVVAAEGLNVVTFQTKDEFDGKNGVEKVISLNPDRVYFMIGLNDVAWRPRAQLIDYYMDIVQDVLDGCPGVDIVILPITPVTREAEERQPGFEDIPAVNSELEAMAATLGVRYFDYTDAFKDSDGYILEEYSSGEFHWSREGYILFGELIGAYDSSLD